MTKDYYQVDSIMHVVQALIKTGMVQMIMYITTHNVILCVTIILPKVVLKYLLNQNYRRCVCHCVKAMTQ